MRQIRAALWLTLAAGPAMALELEEDVTFPAIAVERAELAILSTTDTGVFRAVIEGFQERHPDVSIRYSVASSREVHQAVQQGGPEYDLAISSAMDLQMQLANDGRAQAYASPEVAALPRWARWQDQLFAFTQEPVVMIVSRTALEGLPLPRTRRDLIGLMRDHPDRFRGRIGTYDPEQSGAGYMFATQDARQSDTFWRLAEVMGSLAPRLYTATSDMIADLQSEQLTLAYNVLGSYATPRLAGDPDTLVIEPEDYTLTLLRTALIPDGAARPEIGGAFLDFLLSAEGRQLIGEKAGLPPVDEAELLAHPNLRPIRLDPGLLIYLDQLQRRAFLEEWRSALIQP